METQLLHSIAQRVQHERCAPVEQQHRFDQASEGTREEGIAYDPPMSPPAPPYRKD